MGGGARPVRSWAEVDEALSGAEKHLRAVLERSGGEGGTKRAGRKSATSPDESHVPADEASGERLARIRQFVWEQARSFGQYGGKREDLLGRSGPIAGLVGAIIQNDVTQIERAHATRESELRREIARNEAHAKVAQRVAPAQAHRAAELARKSVRVAAAADALDRKYDALPAAERSAGLVGMEAFIAVALTALADASAFILCVRVVGGAIWQRIAAGMLVSIALAAVVVTVGRLLASRWRDGVGSSDRARIPPARRATLAVCLAATVAFTAVTAVLASATPALAVAATSAGISSALAIGWWTYASRGARLKSRRAEVEARRSRLNAEQRRLAEAAVASSRRAIELITDAQRAHSELAALPQRTESRKAHHLAEAEALLLVARDGFTAGVEARPNEPRPSDDEDAQRNA